MRLDSRYNFFWQSDKSMIEKETLSDVQSRPTYKEIDYYEIILLVGKNQLKNAEQKIVTTKTLSSFGGFGYRKGKITPTTHFKVEREK